MSECIPTEDRNNVFPQEKKNPSDSCGKEYPKAFGKMKAQLQSQNSHVLPCRESTTITDKEAEQYVYRVWRDPE